MQFHCPICGEALSAEGNSLRCSRRHGFDVAKEGYCNLLLVQRKASLDPGDNKEMVEARRRFLAAGYFAPIAEKLTDVVRSLGVATPAVLDAGCGEGYYLACLQQAIPGADLVGIDISKWAVRAAAKSHREIAWAVASSKQLPLAPASLDVVLCVFGFPFWESFRSVLKPGGRVVLVDPAPEHLWELRELVYETVRTTDLSPIDGALAAGFRLEEEKGLSFEVALPNRDAIADLLAMTPHGYRLGPTARERLSQTESLRTRAAVVYRTLRLS